MHQQQEDLQPVGPRRRVLKRVRGVRVVEAAAVGAEFLDGLLAGHRAAGDGLLAAAKRGDDLVSEVEVLDRAAGDQHDRAHDADGQQDAQHRAHQVDPEVPQFACARSGEPSHQRDRHRHAHGGGNEVLHREAGHLDEVALGRFTRIGLPVGVGDEADRRVPRQPRGHVGGRIMQVQRQFALYELEHEQKENAHRRERQHTARVGAPGLLRAGINTDQPVYRPLDRRVFFRRVHPVHVVAEGHVHEHQCQRRGQARKITPAVVVLTRTSPGTAGRIRGTAQEGWKAPSRRCFRSSQPLDQLLHQAEHGEHRHREHDVHQYAHLVSVPRRIACIRKDLIESATAQSSEARSA